jgi:hypothetical protein
MPNRPMLVALGALLLLANASPRAQMTLPFKLPQLPGGAQLPNSFDALKQQAMEVTLRTTLDNELPLKLDDTKVFPTVAQPPGGPFIPRTLKLTAADMDTPLTPGDYRINVLAYCTEYSVHRPGAGTAYVLAPLQGKAADAISNLLTRGTYQGYPFQQLQGVSWSIQSGLTYAQMPKTYQGVIDQLIPEFKGELNGNFVQSMKDTYQAAAKNTKLPPLEQVLARMGSSGQLALSAMRQQDILARQDTSDQLREQTLFRGQESGIVTPVRAQQGPWSERVAGRVYERFTVVGGNGAGNNVLEIRILPENPTRTAGGAADGLVRVSYGMQRVLFPNPQPTPRELSLGIIAAPEGAATQNLVPQMPPTPYPCQMSDAAWNKYVAESKTYIPAGTCACPRAQWNMCPNGQNSIQPTLTGSHLNVYTGVCLGATQNGIEFNPKNLPAACNAGNTHIWQFVKTLQPDGVSARTYDSGSCPGTKRTYGQWYLDACPGINPANVDSHLSPEVTANGVNLAMDQPSPYDNGGVPTTKDFYDVLMCAGKVIDAASWSETGVANPQSCKTGDGNTRIIQGQYGAVSEIANPTANSGLASAVCSGISQTNPDSAALGTTQSLNQISAQFKCPATP